jgi:hypothetical protein
VIEKSPHHLPSLLSSVVFFATSFQDDQRAFFTAAISEAGRAKQAPV